MNRLRVTVGLLSVGLGMTAFAMLVQRGRLPSVDHAARDRIESPTAAQDRTAGRVVAELQRDGSAKSMRKLGRHYRDWAGLPDKLAARQAIVDAMFGMPDRQRGLSLLLAALRDDPTALADDPLLERVTAQLTALWEEQPELYDHGRDLLLTERGDKGRLVLASSLVAYLEGPGANLPDPEHQRRAHLAGDLADAYFQTTDDFARERMQDGIRQIAGTDVAAVVSDPLAVDVRKLSLVEGEVGAMHDRIGELAEGEAGGTYEHLLDQLRALAEFDQEGLIEQVIAQP